MPWAETVITAGPDFFFQLGDFDKNPNTIELVAAQFFDPAVALYVLNAGNGTLLHSRVIDDSVGSTEGVSLVDFNGDGKLELMVNNHVDTSAAGVFAYEVPADIYTGQFVKHTLASGFKTVRGTPPPPHTYTHPTPHTTTHTTTPHTPHTLPHSHTQPPPHTICTPHNNNCCCQPHTHNHHTHTPRTPNAPHPILPSLSLIECRPWSPFLFVRYRVQCCWRLRDPKALHEC